MNRDVVVTGLGAITAVGTSADEFWEGLCSGENGASELTRIDPDEYGINSRVACEVDADFVDHDLVDERSTGRNSRMAIVTAEQAMTDAGLFDGEETVGVEPDRLGVSVGAARGDMPVLEDTIRNVDDGGRIPIRMTIQYLPNMAAGYISREFDAQGPSSSPSTACAAGTHAIARALDDIRLGRVDVAIAGGTDASLTSSGIGGFDAMRALSTRNDDPGTASRPFDVDRDGFVIGEGAGMIVLESREHARERGATPYAELSGSGRSSDAEHPTRPPKDGHGLKRAVENALSDARRDPDEVDHVNTHGTSTPRGDAHEATALGRVFDDVPPVTGNKSMIGHTLGAAGAIEAVAVVQSLREGVIPPTINYFESDPECDVPVVTEPTETDLDVAISNSAGFGGTNGSLVFERP